MRKPGDMFDRDFEWVQLGLFADDARGRGPTLGVVSGRRRQGKTFLLRALCQATGRLLLRGGGGGGRRVAAAGRRGPRGGTSGRPRRCEFADWREASRRAAAASAASGPVAVVIDEFPYLARRESVAALDRPERVRAAARRARAQPDPAAAVRLGARRSWGRLLGGSAPLRGRAGLELIVPTLDYRLAARVLGRAGSGARGEGARHRRAARPAYRREFARDDTPAGPG